MDEIQWGTFPFQPEAYVSLGTVTLRFPPYWFGPTHWGRGPMETGVYMLGTLQALAESSSNVLTRYIPFAFQM